MELLLALPPALSPIPKIAPDIEACTSLVEVLLSVLEVVLDFEFDWLLVMVDDDVEDFPWVLEAVDPRAALREYSVRA